MSALKARPATRRRQVGMSLVEILVGVLIGMIGVVVIFQVLAVAEQRKRSTVHGGAAQTAGAVALYALQRELQGAGNGIGTAKERQLGCNVHVYDAMRAPESAANQLDFKLVPIQIIDGAGGAPDTIATFWGNPSQFVTSGELKAWTGPATGPLTLVGGRAGFDWGDILLVTSDPKVTTVSELPGFGIPPSSGQLTQCALVQVTERPSDTGVRPDDLGKALTINFKNAWQSPDPAGVAMPPAGALKTSSGTPRYNKAAGWPDNLTPTAGFVLNLGKQPRRMEWSISGDRLVFIETLANSPGGEVATGVLNMQAEYGIDSNNNNMIDANEWTVTPPDNSGAPSADCSAKPATSWRCVRAIRVALLARSDHMDHTSCSPNPQWTSGASGALALANFVMKNVDGTNDAFSSPCGAPDTASPNDWRRYRYSVYETVIPLRNMIWGTAP